MYVRWFLVLVASACVEGQNCRGEEPRPRDCDKVCDEHNNCRIRAALLLPKNTTYDACLSAVEPVLELALQSKAVQEVFPSWVQFEWLTYDVTDCDAAYAVISAIDAYNDCTHVFFGPACDFALASVARITKFLGKTGLPVVTTGGFSFDFVKPKKTCKDEYYMLVRAGTMGFEDVAHFIIDLMRQFGWNRGIIIYDTPAYESSVGATGGFLLASTIHSYLLNAGINIFGWEILSHQSFEDMLRSTVGNNFASEFNRGMLNTVSLYRSLTQLSSEHERYS